MNDFSMANYSFNKDMRLESLIPSYNIYLKSGLIRGCDRGVNYILCQPE